VTRNDGNINVDGNAGKLVINKSETSDNNGTLILYSCGHDYYSLIDLKVTRRVDAYAVKGSLCCYIELDTTSRCIN
jgi:hypothetical protein